MGGFATSLAAMVVHADNLPTNEVLPDISWQDVLLPQCVKAMPSSQEEILNADREEASTRLRYSEVKRDRKGRSVLINHRAKPARLVEAHDSATNVERLGNLKAIQQSPTDTARKDEDFVVGADISGKDTVKQDTCANCAGLEKQKTPHNSAASCYQSSPGNMQTLASKTNGRAKSFIEKVSEDKPEIGDQLESKIVDPVGDTATNKSADEGRINSVPMWERDKQRNVVAEDGKTSRQVAKEFGLDDDKRLKDLKAAGKTWREIAQEMKRSQQLLKTRFKEINKEGATEGGDADNRKPTVANTSIADENAGKRNTRAERKTNHAKEDKSNGSVVNLSNGPCKMKTKPNGEAKGKVEKHKKENQEEAVTKTPSKVSSKTTSKVPSIAILKTPAKARSECSLQRSNSGSGEVLFSEREWLQLTNDDCFAYDELRTLADIIIRTREKTCLTYDNWEFWYYAASKFYDKTGRRVHPLDVRDKFANLSAPGLD